MKSRTKVLIAIILVLVIMANIFAYIGVINGSSAIVKLVQTTNLAYAAPKVYSYIADKVKHNPGPSDYSAKQLEELIYKKSLSFVTAAFSKDDAKVKQLLDSSAKYIRSKDGSSFIRYIGGGIHVEGYMATDRKLIYAKQRWYLLEDDNTITCCIEVYIEGNKAPEFWYLHYKKVKNDWKLYMLENEI